MTDMLCGARHPARGNDLELILFCETKIALARDARPDGARHKHLRRDSQMKRLSTLLILVLTLCACARKPGESTTTPGAQDLQSSLDSITSEDLLKHIKVLASDEFEGRAPGTKGEDLTINYLTEQFKAIGLKPGNPDGTYLQK